MNQVVKYSICIPNLNMENTIEEALRSVLDQIDDEYEVIVVDDGSTDRSVEILRSLELEYPNLFVHELPRDPNRILAETRNISISFARGQYLLLHIDCDDYWYPFIKDFVKVYHEIEKFKGPDFLLSGQQINMGEAKFLKSHGPYQEGHMVEDRDMWYRLAKIGAYVPLDHVVFRKRMKLKQNQILRKKFIRTVQVVRDEIRSGSSLLDFLKLFLDHKHSQNWKYRLYKLIIFPIAWLMAKRMEPLPRTTFNSDWQDLRDKAWSESGTVLHLFKKNGRIFDVGKLSPRAQIIFTHRASEISIEEVL